MNLKLKRLVITCLSALSLACETHSLQAEEANRSNTPFIRWHDVSSINRFIKYLKGTNDCKTKIYPNLTTIGERRKAITQNKKMLEAHCSGAWSNYCATFLEMKNLPKEAFNQKMMANFTFFKEVMTIDLHQAFIQKPKSRDEIFYYVFINTLLQKLDWVEKKVATRQSVETVFVGDSLMHLFDIPGKENFPNAAFMGIAGDRTDSLLFRLSHMVLSLRPKNVVLSITGNDLIQECKKEKIDYNRKLIIKFLKLFGVQNIYWVSVPPVLLPGLIKPIQNENSKISSEKEVTYLDTYSSMAGPNSMYKDEYISRDGKKVDLIHFNQKGYEDVWIPIFKSLGLK